MGASREQLKRIVDELVRFMREDFRYLDSLPDERKRRFVKSMREVDPTYQLPEWDAAEVRAELERSVADEAPRHEVTLSPFLISKYEVSQEQWRRVMGNDPTPSWFQGRGLPVLDVDWVDCQRFCAKTGLRLPTEAQWEYACRGGTESLYSFGDEIDDERARFHDDPGGEWPRIISGESSAGPVPVDSFAPNPFGLHHMHGNAEEWCEDVYDAECYADGVGGRADPYRAEGSPQVVRRGGFCLGHRLECRSSSRRPVDIAETRLTVGFRPVFHLVSTATTPAPEESIARAVERYDDACRRQPSARNLLARASVLRKLDRVDESDDDYRRAAEVSANSRRLWLEYGELLVREERYDEAITSFDRAIDASEDYVSAWWAKAELLEVMKRDPAALECHERLTELEPSNSWSWERQGWLLVGLRRPREAVRRFDRAIESAPDWRGGWYGKGVAESKVAGRSQAAIRALERAVKLGDDDARKYLRKLRARS